ncbi:tRNA-dihydrouridine synthase family protein, partial [Patescibacteria group bacterium]|nr:tRNA-dihydrouridine synthase family protein [Patescibacteria group bacterium]
MKPDWKTIRRPIIGLSPMAEMTDSPFCRVVKSLSSPIIFREMVSADALVHGNEKTLKMLDIHDEERPLVQQIFGRDPEIMAQAAKIVMARQNPEFIDLNMGCPAKKLTGNFHGCALMKDPELAAAIVKAVKAAVDVPVSVKTRTGWSDKKEILEFAQVLEQAGADLITIHGRTKKQAYAGRADWDI